MTTVESDVFAANLSDYLKKVEAGETFLIASNRRPLAELRPTATARNAPPDEQELARRRELGHRLEALRAEITARHGIHPDSTPMIREMRDNE